MRSTALVFTSLCHVVWGPSSRESGVAAAFEASLPSTPRKHPALFFTEPATLQPQDDESLSLLLQENLEWHQQAISKSENLFYGFDFTPQEWESAKQQIQPMEWQSHSFPGLNGPYLGDDALPPPPFAMDDLARISLQPILSWDDCDRIVQEAETMGRYFGWHTQARYGTPQSKVGAMIPLEELSISYTLVNFELLPRLFLAMAETFPKAIPNPSSLRLGGARVLRYDASMGQTELGFHRDGLLLTANIALNHYSTNTKNNEEKSEYTGGGTILEALSSTEPVCLSKGHALLHPGDLRHAGAPITTGKRYVLVLFILDKNHVPHDRYCAERGERDLALAKIVCDDDDPTEKQRLLQSARQQFANAIRFGARIDDVDDRTLQEVLNHQPLTNPTSYHRLVRLGSSEDNTVII